MKECKVYFFGDSICVGQGVSPHKVWVTRIAVELETTFTNFAVTVQNPSVNGNTTRMALERMAYDVQSHQPDVLIVQFGMNDCNIWATDQGNQRVSPAAFVANLSEIIRRGRAFGAKKLLLGVNHPTTRIKRKMPNSSITYDQSNRHYNSLIRSVAEATRTELVDMERTVDDAVRQGARLSDFVLKDQVHLSDLGHEIYFSAYGRVVKKAVRLLLEGAKVPRGQRLRKSLQF